MQNSCTYLAQNDLLSQLGSSHVFLAWLIDAHSLNFNDPIELLKPKTLLRFQVESFPEKIYLDVFTSCHISKNF